MKASVIERFNRTLKEKMYRYFTTYNTKRYTDVIQDLVNSYNKTYHRSIKMTPSEVTPKNVETVRRNLYGSQKEKNYIIEFKFKIGDYVRISKYKKLFQKGYLPNWSEEVFQVTENLPRTPPVYKIKDLGGDDILGIFYEQDLQKVPFDKKQRVIGKVLKVRTRNKKKEYLVNWQNYPNSLDTWISEKERNELLSNASQ
jgi:hypothetical protein